ncbi:hypothetical protein HYH02_005085 [Chlamydomonas schloesseri]|uniref:DDE-1 domain-containing protein n=1 Tax=Chlamydomonas schloesseri TaxID=2026947 RepID=A0A835WM89_9CHLO|nr:hypothetical protein HYH02_005085 [Chlamydomonas schloesseri]|eukprot:KAG2449551.1 hypothetical protein HYH02_005085 [Chlamydomonas schloesseri]
MSSWRLSMGLMWSSQARSLGVEILLLPSNCTSQLQPCDQIFGGFKRHLSRERTLWLNGRALTALNEQALFRLVGIASQACFTPAAMANAFGHCGLSPMDPEKVLQRLPSDVQRVAAAAAAAAAAAGADAGPEADAMAAAAGGGETDSGQGSSSSGEEEAEEDQCAGDAAAAAKAAAEAAEKAAKEAAKAAKAAATALTKSKSKPQLVSENVALSGKLAAAAAAEPDHQAAGGSGGGTSSGGASGGGRQGVQPNVGGSGSSAAAVKCKGSSQKQPKQAEAPKAPPGPSGTACRRGRSTQVRKSLHEASDSDNEN